MKRFAVAFGFAVLGLGLLVFLSVTLLAPIYLTPERLEKTLAVISGRNVEIDGPVVFSFWGEPRVTLSQLHFKNPVGSTFKHLATLDSISVGLRFWDALALVTGSPPHFLDIEVGGGKVHVDARQDVLGNDGVWPSADDPFTAMLGWIHTLRSRDLHVEIQVGEDRLRQIQLERLHARFDTGEKGAVIVDAVDLDVAIDDFPIEGSLRLDAPLVEPGLAPPASLTGKLKISRLEFGSLLDPPASRGPVLPLDEPLPVDDCISWDTDLAISIDALGADDSTFQDLAFTVQSTAGHWTVRLVDGSFPAGRGKGEVSLHCGQLPGAFDLKTQVSSQGTSQFDQSGATFEMLGRMESTLTLAGQGSTWKEILQDLSGRFLVFLGPVQTGALQSRIYSRSLFHALTVSWGQPKKATVDCAVFDMHFEKGIGRSQHLVITTPSLVISGAGQVDLIKDKIDIVMIPYSKHLRLGRIHVPVRISGSIQDPAVGLDWEDVVQRLGIETTAALIDPILPILSFDGRLAKEELDACRRSLKPLDLPAATHSKGG